MSRLSRKLLGGAATLALALFAAGSAHAADVYLITSNGFGGTWATGSVWSNNAAAAAGNKYYVGRDPNGNSTGITFNTASADFAYRSDVRLRTGDNNSNQTFPGDQLILTTSGTLFMKNQAPGIITISDLIVKNNGSLTLSSYNTTSTLDGKITFSDTPLFLVPNVGRHFQLNSQLVGNGTITVANKKSEANAIIDPTADNFVLNNNTNTFSGAFNVIGFTFAPRQSNAIQNVTTTTINSDAIFQSKAGVNINAPNMALVVKTGGKVQINSDITVKKLFINGKETTGTSAKVFTAAKLSPTYPGQFTGTGRIIVTNPVPVEMSAFKVD